MINSLFIVLIIIHTFQTFLSLTIRKETQPNILFKWLVITLFTFEIYLTYFSDDETEYLYPILGLIPYVIVMIYSNKVFQFSLSIENSTFDKKYAKFCHFLKVHFILLFIRLFKLLIRSILEQETPENIQLQLSELSSYISLHNSKIISNLNETQQTIQTTNEPSSTQNILPQSNEPQIVQTIDTLPNDYSIQQIQSERESIRTSILEKRNSMMNILEELQLEEKINQQQSFRKPVTQEQERKRGQTQYCSSETLAKLKKPPMPQISRFSEVDNKIDELFKKLNANKSKLQQISNQQPLTEKN